jgi:hypothetical protein
MVKLPLGHGKYALIDDEDYPKIMFGTWHCTKSGYVAGRLYGERVYLHRIIMEAKPHEEVDHEDDNPLNNQKYNLRLCTRSQNEAAKTRRRDNISGYKGVTYNKFASKWKARTHLNGNEIHLGYFDTAEDAARAYDRKAKEIFGKFARLNFPEESGHGQGDNHT